VYRAPARFRLVGDLQVELLHDFFDGFAVHCGANVHLRVLYGRSSHHRIEALFKCWAKAMRFACAKDPQLRDQLPSTKGVLAKGA
jgi:imidazoleglycerol-phosphate dehydratase